MIQPALDRSVDDGDDTSLSEQNSEMPLKLTDQFLDSDFLEFVEFRAANLHMQATVGFRLNAVLAGAVHSRHERRTIDLESFRLTIALLVLSHEYSLRDGKGHTG